MTADRVLYVEAVNRRMDGRTVIYERVTFEDLRAMPEDERRRYTWVHGTDYWVKREIVEP